MGAGFTGRRGQGRAAPYPQQFWVCQLVMGAAVTLAGSLGTLMGALLTKLFCVPTVLPGAAMLP